MEVGLYLDIIIYFGILSQTTWADENGGNINLSCKESVTRKLQSPNYPHSDYNDKANITWNVTAPTYQGIAVVFKAFDTEEGYDILTIQDPVRSFRTRNYSGSLKNIPPFMSTWSSLLFNFQSNDRRPNIGFSLELHCYETSERTSNIKLKSSARANEGILEVLNPNNTNEWLPVCNESWNSTLANISCTQLGFPEAYHFASEVDEQYNKSTCAKIDCGESDFLLHQCAFKLESQDSMNTSRLNCFTFGYRGCFPLPTNFDTFLRSTATEVGDCLHMCSTMSFQLAAIGWDGCYCLNESQSRIHLEISKNARCILECDSSQGTECPPKRSVWAFHYDVTIGSCEHPGEVAHGWWSSNHTYLGSRLTLTCEPGYVINGSKTIECKRHDDDQKIDWDSEIPQCQSLSRLISTSQPREATAPERSTPPLANNAIPSIAGSLLGSIVVIILLVILVYHSRKRKVHRPFINKQISVRNGPTTSADDSSLINVTTIKSTSQVADIELSTSVPPHIVCESSIRNEPKEETSKGNPQQEEGPTSMLSADKSPADEYATVSKVRQDDKNSSTAATSDEDKRKTRADALLEGSGRVETHVKSSCGKSHTMRNRPLPQCPKDGAIKPPVAPRKAQTLTRKDQAGASDFSMNTSKENLQPATTPLDRGHVNKKAPGGSTPYVTARGKRAKKTKNKGNHQLKGVSCDDSAISASQRLSDTSSSAYSPIDHSPEKGNMSSLDKTEKSLSSNNNSNSVLLVINAETSEQTYCDINDANGDKVSKCTTGGASALNGRFGEDLKPSNPAVQHASNLYHTLEPTNAEYEDIRNTEAKFNGNGAYDLLNF